MIPLTKDKRMLGYEVLAPYPDISCFVTTRHGGCSTGSYASFNCTPYTGDNADCVRKNRELLCAALPVRPQELIIPFQTHGTDSLIIDDTYLNATRTASHAARHRCTHYPHARLLHLHLHCRLHSRIII